jgi:hypothetical protein
MSQAGIISVAASGGAIETINGDVGSITGTTVTIYADNAALQAGSSVEFVNSGTISTLVVTDSSNNTIIGKGAGNASLSGSDSVGLGTNVLSALTTGSQNSFGGYESGQKITSGSFNSGWGLGSLGELLTGSFNIAYGYDSGTAYESSESSNICIGNPGVTGESNAVRIGTQGSSTQEQNKCFIAGIVGVTASNPELVTINSSTGQLGVQALTQNGLLFGGASNSVSQTSVVDNGVVITSAGGVPETLANGTAGYVLTANSGAPPSWQAASSSNLTVTSVAVGASPYTVLSTDQFLAVQSTGGAITIKLPNAPATGRVIVIKDSTNDAATNNISVTTVGGTVTIDGQTTYTMNVNYQAISVVFDGSNYEVF